MPTYSVIETPAQAIEVPTQTEILAESVRNMLSAIGEDSHREGLRRTPERVAKALTEMTSAVDMDERIGSGWNLPRLLADDLRSLSRQRGFTLNALDGMIK